MAQVFTFLKHAGFYFEIFSFLNITDFLPFTVYSIDYFISWQLYDYIWMENSIQIVQLMVIIITLYFNVILI